MPSDDALYTVQQLEGISCHLTSAGFTLADVRRLVKRYDDMTGPHGVAKDYLAPFASLLKENKDG